MQRVTQEQRKKNHGLEQRIQAAGVPIAETMKNDTSEVSIRQDFEAFDGVLFEFSGGTGIVLPLKIVPQMPLFVLTAVDIRLNRLPNAWFRLLEERQWGDWPHYLFDGQPAMKFDRGETINRCITQQVRVHRGNPIHGLLLASWLDTLPADILGGQILEGCITIWDQFDHEYDAKIRLRVDRAHGQTSTRQPSSLKTRGSLFSKRDTSPIK